MHHTKHYRDISPSYGTKTIGGSLVRHVHCHRVIRERYYILYTYNNRIGWTLWKIWPNKLYFIPPWTRVYPLYWFHPPSHMHTLETKNGGKHAYTSRNTKRKKYGSFASASILHLFLRIVVSVYRVRHFDMLPQSPKSDIILHIPKSPKR